MIACGPRQYSKMTTRKSNEALNQLTQKKQVVTYGLYQWFILSQGNEKQCAITKQLPQKIALMGRGVRQSNMVSRIRPIVVLFCFVLFSIFVPFK